MGTSFEHEVEHQNRGTGRTTRMLEQAVALASSHSFVVVLAAHSRESEHVIRIMMQTMTPEAKVSMARREIMLGNGNIIKFFSNYHSGEFSEERLHRGECPLRGYPHDIPTLIDHHAADTRPWAQKGNKNV